MRVPLEYALTRSIYDLIGCDYNMPADYTTLQNDGLFIACEGGIQSEVGTYTSGAQSEQFPH